MSEFATKVASIRELLASKKLESAVIRRNPNLAWLIAGRVHVPSAIDAACFDLVISQDDVYAVTNAIEAPRLIAEEFPATLAVKIVEWWGSRDSLLPTGDKVGSDQAGAGRVDIGREIEILRQQLSSVDINRLQEVAVDSSMALGEALKKVEKSDREIDVAGRISQALWKSNLELVFLGIAGEDRVKKYRHPLPTTSLVGNRVVASICARRKGLIASVTRIVTFGDLSESALNEYTSLLRVEAAIFDATRVGAAFSTPLEAAIRAYPENGFDTDEWQRHHQGGPTGFLPRDWPATPTSQHLILANQAISWNPTGKGWKVEDTIITTDTDIKILSLDSSWPSREISGRLRPDILRR